MTELHADIAVVGAGPGGIAAAATAAELGARVALVDAAPRAGGQIWRQGPGAATSRAAAAWLRRVQHVRIVHVHGAEVIDADGRFTLHLSTGARVHAPEIILAAGARELFLPFPGWTLPGVVGIGGAQALLKSGLDVRGRRIVISGSGPLLLPVAASLARAGATVLEVVEQAPPAAVWRFAAGLWRHPSRAVAAMRYRTAFLRTRYRAGTWVMRAHGRSAVERVTLTDGSAPRDVACDLLCTGYGLVPSTELARLLGCSVLHGAVVCDDVQRTTLPSVHVAGEAAGVAGVECAVIEGRIAAMDACGASIPPELKRARARERSLARRMHAAFALRPELRSLAADDTVLCRCEDVRCGDVARHDGARAAKLHTRLGMGPCQGRVCGPAARHLFGWEEDTVRAPLFPARIDAMIPTVTGDADAEE